MDPLEDALAEQKRRSESMARSAEQSFQSIISPLAISAEDLRTAARELLTSYARRPATTPREMERLKLLAYEAGCTKEEVESASRGESVPFPHDEK